MSILRHFPGEPRAEQAAALDEVARVWGDYDCLVIVGPTGIGKSKMAECIARWVADQAGTCSIVPPDSTLQTQYEEGCDLPSLWAVDQYRCQDRLDKTCGQRRRSKAKVKCQAECPYATTVERAKTGARIMHTATYLGTKKIVGYPDVLIVDEAHRLIPFMQDKAGAVSLWRPKHGWPMDLKTHEDVIRWVEGCSVNMPYGDERLKALKLLRKGDCLVEKACRPLRNTDQWVLRVAPLSVRRAAPILWPKTVKKLVLMSATIGDIDVTELGVDRFRRVGYVYCQSPIPPSARPVVVMPYVVTTKQHLELNFPAMADLIERLRTYHHGEAGFVHATYGDACELRAYLSNPKYLWHDQSTKQSVYNYFIRYGAQQQRVMVGSGLHEGIDLKGDRAGWQVLTKVPRLNLGDPAVAAKAEANPAWYAWESVKATLQACGRVCRGPDDYGVTYILDAYFVRLYRDFQYMFPAWFRDSLRF